MAGRKPKHTSLEEVRAAQKKASMKYYEAHREERKAYMKEYYRRTKENKKGEDK